MAKKQTTKSRTKAKELPRKDKKLSTATLKKVKGGLEELSLNYSKITYRPK